MPQPIGRSSAPILSETAIGESFIYCESECSVTRDSPPHHRDRAVIDLIYHHPVAHNLPWHEVLTLIGHIGKTEQKHDSKWLFEVNGLERSFHTPHGDHMEPSEIVKLREFLREVGFVP